MLRGLKKGYNGCFTGISIAVFTMPGGDKVSHCLTSVLRIFLARMKQKCHIYLLFM
jgi:hypothetical protein